MGERCVDEVGDARADRELGDLATGTRVRGDDPVGAGLEELRLGALGVRPGDDEQAGVERPGREGDVDVVRV